MKKKELYEELMGKGSQAGVCSYINGVLNLAQDKLPSQEKDFDQQHHLFNFKNGTYDFEKFEFREHRAEDMLTKQVDYEYDPEAKCPKTDDFLSIIFQENTELVDFIWRCIAISMTGWVDVDALLFCYGEGSNGKSTFFNWLRKLYGEYFKTVTVEILLSKKNSNSDMHYLADLRAARCVLTDELPDNRRLNEAQLKRCIGGDMINACRKYQHPFSFSPTHTLWMPGNYKPEILGADHGTWRRIQLIPFLHTFKGEQIRDRSEVVDELNKELPGAFNRALEGLRDYRENDFNPPKIVTEATAEYREETDVLVDFIEYANTVIDDDMFEAKILFERYNTWSGSQNQHKIFHSSRRFYTALRQRGYDIRKGVANKTFIFNFKSNS